MLLLDADGVVADFRHPATLHLTRETWPKGVYDLEEVTGMNPRELWEDPRVASFEFWAELPKLPWADDLMRVVRAKFRREDICFLTKPIMNPMCAAGKMAWFRKHYPSYKFLIGTSKKFCAGQGKVLIDDYEKNVDEFNNEGGYGILFPQVWNKLHEVTDPVAYVEAALL